MSDAVDKGVAVHKLMSAIDAYVGAKIDVRLHANGLGRRIRGVSVYDQTDQKCKRAQRKLAELGNVIAEIIA